MGKKATITHAVQRQAQERREHFAQKSVASRNNDSATAAASASAPKSSNNNNNSSGSNNNKADGSPPSFVPPPPTPEQAEFLLRNAGDALRIPRASEDLRRLFLSWASAGAEITTATASAAAAAAAGDAPASSSRRRGRDAATGDQGSSSKAELQKKWGMLQGIFEAVKANLNTLVVDDLSSNVICALLPAATRVASDLALDEAAGAPASPSAGGRVAKATDNSSNNKATEELAEFVDALIASIEASAAVFSGNSAEDAGNEKAKKTKKKKSGSDNEDEEENNNNGLDAEEEEEDDDSGVAALARHHVGRRVVCALLEAGNSAQRKTINRILAARTLQLVAHRHGSVCLMRLLQLYPKSAKTIAPALMSGAGGLEAYLSDPIAEKVAEMIITPKTVAAILKDGILPTLVTMNAKIAADAAAGTKLQPWANKSGRLLQNKRWVRFLIHVLDQGFSNSNNKTDDSVVDDEASSPSSSSSSSKQAAAEALTELVAALRPSFSHLLIEERGNLLVQALIRAVVASSSSSSSSGGDLAKTVAKLALTPPEGMTVADLLMHPHAAHVVGQLASAGGDTMSAEVAAVLRPHLMKLVTNQHGSIAVRRFVEAGQGQQQQPDTYQRAETLLDSLIASSSSGDSNAQRLLSDEYGNIVLQSMLRAARQPKRVAFFKQAVKPRLLELCKDQFASRVVHMLLDSYMLDNSTFTDACNTLEKHAVELAQHLNGRFIVEQLVVPSQKVQKRLIEGFADLAAAKGSQQVLTKLYEASTKDARQLIATKVAADLATLATVQSSSMVVQKLLTSDLNLLVAQRQQNKEGGGAQQQQQQSKTPEVWMAVRAALGLSAADGAAGAGMAAAAAGRLLQQLRGDFFGRFVVQLAQSNTPPPPPAQMQQKRK